MFTYARALQHAIQVHIRGMLDGGSKGWWNVPGEGLGGREPPSIPEAREGLPAQKLSWRCRIPRALLFILTELHVRTASFAVLYAVFCMHMANCVL